MAGDIVIENVPRLNRRYGDHVIEGSNNVALILGTDRAARGPATIDHGLGRPQAAGEGQHAGTAHLVAGRASGDPDLTSDASYLYVSMRTMADDNLGLGAIEGARNDLPAAILKSDVVRVVARNDIKITTDDGKSFVFIDGKKVKLKVGNNFVHVTEDEVIINVSGQSKVRVTSTEVRASIGASSLTMTGAETKVSSPKFSTTGGSDAPRDVWFNLLVQAIQNHVHLSAVGPTLPAIAGPGAPIVAPLTPGYQAFKLATLT